MIECEQCKRRALNQRHCKHEYCETCGICHKCGKVLSPNKNNKKELESNGLEEIQNVGGE